MDVARRRAREAALALVCCTVGPALCAAPAVDVRASAEAAAREVLAGRAEQAGWLEPQWEMTVLDNTVVRRGAPPLSCARALVVEPVNTQHVSRMRLTVSCPEPEGWRREVVVKARVSARVLVTVNDVPAGRVIADEDLTLARRDVSATPDAVSASQAAVGLTSSRTLRAGQVVARRLLLTPVLVQRGQGVGIVARQGGIEVTVPGEALTAGREGEVVQVRNVASRKVIRARVIDAGKVAPESIPVSAPAQSRE